MPATIEQQAVIDAVRETPTNLAVDAVAGSGKTTTIVNACTVAGGNAGFAAFNTHIAAELKLRLNGTADAATFHAMGFRILGQKCPSIQLEKTKVKRKLKEVYPQFHRAGTGRWKDHVFLRPEWECLPDVIDVIRQQAFFPSDDQAAIKTACYKQGVDFSAINDPTEFWATAEESSRMILEDTSTCDFADMIAMPVYHGWVRPIYKTLFVDESQDLNPAQQQLVRSSAERLVCVGDPHQGIMAFAGADIHSFQNLIKHLGNHEYGVQSFPLSCCFRCPTSHLDLARHLVPHIQAKPTAEQGEFGEVSVAKLIAEATAGDMVLCRNTAPLVSLAFALIRNRTPVFVRGRKIGDGLKRLAQKFRATSIRDLLNRLEQWRGRQIEKLEMADAPDDAIQEVSDQADSLKVLAEDSETIDELIGTIDSLFGDAEPGGKLCLSTVHRAKGLEADRVWIYEPGLMPNRINDPQELNLLYVALTRAKRSLFLVDGDVRRKSRAHAWVKDVAVGFSRWELTEKKDTELEAYSD